MGRGEYWGNGREWLVGKVKGRENGKCVYRERDEWIGRAMGGQELKLRVRIGNDEMGEGCVGDGKGRVSGGREWGIFFFFLVKADECKNKRKNGKRICGERLIRYLLSLVLIISSLSFFPPLTHKSIPFISAFPPQLSFYPFLSLPLFS